MAFNIEAGTKEYGIRTDLESDLAVNVIRELVKQGWVSSDTVSDIVLEEKEWLLSRNYLNGYAKSHGVDFIVASAELDNAVTRIENTANDFKAPSLAKRLSVGFRRIFNG